MSIEVQGKLLCVDCGSDMELFEVKNLHPITELPLDRIIVLCRSCITEREEEEEESN